MNGRGPRSAIGDVTKAVILILLLSGLSIAVSCQSTRARYRLLEGGAKPPVRLPGSVKPVRIDFAPPARKTLTEHCSATLTEPQTEEGGRGSPHSQTVEAVTSTRFEPTDASEWVLTQSIQPVAAPGSGSRGAPEHGASTEKDWLKWVTAFALRARLTGDGQLVRLLNPEDAQRALTRSSLNASAQETLGPLITSDSIEEQVRREWDSKYRGLFNRNLEVGATFYSVESIDIGRPPPVTLGLERRVNGTVKTDFGEAVDIGLRCTTAGAGSESDRSRLEPSAECSGGEIVAIKPFIPVKSWLKLTARRLTFSKTTTALKLE